MPQALAAGLHIDFRDPAHPVMENVEYDFETAAVAHFAQ